jgi:hypothetical protein
MGNFFGLFTSCFKSNNEINEIVLNETDLCKDFYLNSYYHALFHENFCKMCEKPKNLTKGLLFCDECKEKYQIANNT